MASPLITPTDRGLYCPPGDFYIDPWQPVDRAVITHAHGDHSRRGNARYLAAAPAEGVLRTRLGEIDLQTLPYGETVDHFGVRLSFHPAGHVLGSAQVRLEHEGRVWVASGDYYVAGCTSDASEDNQTCAPFEPVRCDTFYTESTFGLPIYRWDDPATTFQSIASWWKKNRADNRASVLFAYALGKAQRVLAGLAAHYGGDLPGPVFCHGAVEGLRAGIKPRQKAKSSTKPETQKAGKGVVAGKKAEGNKSATAPTPDA